MEIGEITDIDKLKAMAYDEIKKLELAQNKLSVINGRIAQLQVQPTTDKPEE